MKTNLPNFAVSSAADGFDEFLKVFNEYYNEGIFVGSFKYYGSYKNSAFVADFQFAPELTPSQAIALLQSDQPKQLTVEDLNTYNKALSPESQPEIVPVQEENQTEKLLTNQIIKDSNELVQEENRKDEIDIYKRFRTILSRYQNMKNLSPMQIGNFCRAMSDLSIEKDSQTAHLQQQLKEAKELLILFADGKGVYKDNINKINQFLTRNK